MAMKAVLLIALVLGSAPAAQAAQERSAVTPVQKVLDLMHGMLQKGKKEKHDEAVQYAAYKQFCEDVSAEKKAAIEEANTKIEVLKADIEQYIANVERLTKEIAQHDQDIATWEGDIKAATKVRKLEHGEYTKLHKDYSESIDALQRAIEVIKKEAHDIPQKEEKPAAETLLQVQSLRLVPSEAKKAIRVFLQQPDEEEETLDTFTAPEANAYEFHSHGIIEMLAKLLDKFIGERSVLEREEANKAHAYDMVVADLEAQIAQATQDRTEKSESKAKNLEDKASAEDDLEETTKSRNEDQKYLKDLVAVCSQKADDFESRQQLRAEEIEAIEKAIEIISSEKVAGNAEEHLPQLAQTAQSPASFAQLRAEATATSKAQTAVVQFLRAQSKKLHSRVLASLADRAEADPFKKVKKMIKDLIVRLMEEANEEAEHKGWCDTELATNEQVRKEKSAEAETLTAEIDELEASIQKLTQEIAELTKAVAELDAAMKEATEIRQAEKAKNLETIKDAQEAQVAVQQALTILKEFYEKAGDATAFVQQDPQPVPPEIFDSPYKGMQSEKGGVVGMLQVIESDFARLESDTKEAETTAQEEYDQFMTDSTADKSAKTTDIEHKEDKKTDQTQALERKRKDLDLTQKELNAALAYFDKLKPSCVDAGVTYEDRVSRRKEEIESLQEALRILGGEVVPPCPYNEFDAKH